MGTQRSSSNFTNAMVEAMRNAKAPPLQPPSFIVVDEQDRPFLLAVYAARARAEWTECDLIVGVQLARCQRDIEVESALMREEGSVVRNERGTQICNPRMTVLERLAGREMALMRCLRMGGRPGGDPRDEYGRREAEQRAKAVAGEMVEEDLLA